MRKSIVPLFLLLLGYIVPLDMSALSIQTQIAPPVALSRTGIAIQSVAPVAGLSGEIRFPILRPPAAATVAQSRTGIAIQSVIGKRRSRVLLNKMLRHTYLKNPGKISDQNKYERAASAWGAASLFTAIVFIGVGLLASSVLVYAFCLLAIPFGILAIINQKKARALGSKRNDGLVLGIVGMSLVGLAATLFILLLIAFTIY